MNLTRNTGFTLIEVLVVVIIIAVLAAVAVPQYQKAVLKSRFSSLMSTIKAVRDGNEVYYMAHGGYAMAVNQLDVTATNNEDMTLELSRDPDYSYVLATRPDLNEKNNLIMYQKHSGQFPGEIHCEALANDTQAEWLCDKGMKATRNLGEVITEGYNTYVIEGTGNGLTPAQLDALNGPNCDKALSMGATCSITEDPEKHTKTKQVCYNVLGENDYCVTMEFDEENRLISRLACSPDGCSESGYDAAGNRTSFKYCYSDNMSADGKSCDIYNHVEEYEYDESGNKTSYKYCDSNNLNAEGKGCARYNSINEYTYDSQGHETAHKRCSKNTNTLTADGKSCDRYDEIQESEYDSNGHRITYKYCNVDTLTEDGKNCGKYIRIDEYSRNSAGEILTTKTCSKKTGTMSTDQKSCTKYDNISEYRYDENGHQIFYANCNDSHGNLSSDMQSCKTYGFIHEYTYNSEGKMATSKYCGQGRNTPFHKPCDTYSIVEFSYDEEGNRISEGRCTTNNFSADGKSCNKYESISQYEYDSSHQQTAISYCSGNNMSANGKSCGTYDYRSEYGQDEAGNYISNYCQGGNVSADGKSCIQYDEEYFSSSVYDEDGNEMYYKGCYWNEDHTECEIDEAFYSW